MVLVMKGKLRAIMKAMNIASIIVNGHADAAKGNNLAPVIAGEKAVNASTIPSWCWCMDKPKLDKRRYRKYMRGVMVVLGAPPVSDKKQDNEV